MDNFLGEYFPIAVFFAIAIGLSAAFVLSAFVVGNQRPDEEKLAAYECGFDAFDDSIKIKSCQSNVVNNSKLVANSGGSPWGTSINNVSLFFG